MKRTKVERSAADDGTDEENLPLNPQDILWRLETQVLTTDKKRRWDKRDLISHHGIKKRRIHIRDMEEEGESSLELVKRGTKTKWLTMLRWMIGIKWSFIGLLEGKRSSSELKTDRIEYRKSIITWSEVCLKDRKRRKWRAEDDWYWARKIFLLPSNQLFVYTNSCVLFIMMMWPLVLMQQDGSSVPYSSQHSLCPWCVCPRVPVDGTQEKIDKRSTERSITFFSMKRTLGMHQETIGKGSEKKKRDV